MYNNKDSICISEGSILCDQLTMDIRNKNLK